MFWRQLTQRAGLYTEMVTTGAIIHAGPERFLTFHNEEHPVALQLGGSNPAELAQCAKIAEEWGYDEINLNCGCPSDRVQSGMFGACLMAHPQRVADCIKAMQDACNIPVTIKHRIGIDAMESYDEMLAFIEPVQATGCNTFIVHARKAWLQGLSPKQNREIPPLNYPMVYQLKKDFPELEIIINGGITTVQDSIEHLSAVDGVMLGRAAYHNPYLLTEVDAFIYDTVESSTRANTSVEPDSSADKNGNSTIGKSRDQVLLDFIPYIEEQLAEGAQLNHITRHILGLFQSVPGAKLFRRHISQNAHKRGAGIEVVYQAMELVNDAQYQSGNYRDAIL
jgi:tRNA-dihydrouridine synthase A